MKVAKYYNNKDIRLEQIPTPSINDGEILVKVKASGICGTDVMEWYRIKKAPRVLGHEMAGEVIESKSKKVKVGQRVFVSHHVPCNDCKYCREGNHTACETLHQGNYDPGGFSEFVRIPKINVDFGTYILPQNISYEEATMIEPLGCVIRAQRLINIEKNHTVLIFGCGVSGLLNIQLAKSKGANVIASDINEFRLKKALRYEADNAYKAGDLNNIIAERIITCTGAAPVFSDMFRFIDKKGIIMLFAIPKEDFKLPVVDFWRNELTILSSYGAAPDDLEESLNLIDKKVIRVKDMITDRVSLDNIQKGFALVEKAQESLKVVVIP